MKGKQVVCISKGIMGNNPFHAGWKYSYFIFGEAVYSIHVQLRGKRGFWTVPKTANGFFTHGSGLMFRILEEADE